MSDPLHDAMPPDAIAHPLPGTRPLAPGDWLRRDERFATQMALRDDLIANRRAAVIDLRPEAREAADELLARVMDEVGTGGDSYARPDGVTVPLDRADPLATLGRLCQEDFAIMLAGEAEHWLAGGVICFPSRWTLAQKMGRPLTAIHTPVPQYDDGIARRVQRLFDGVRVEQPIVRWNHIPYLVDELHNPQPEFTVVGPEVPRPFLRRERQVLVRLPETRAVVFSIHTYLVRA
ncbi:MAG: DUF3445 domain-containing protein [Pseudomonadota bacterium]|nr:DUF3445 domain-containing protein [Pseudomonadota bacterium]